MPEKKLYRIVILIANPDVAEKAERYLSEIDAHIQYRMNVQGTASSDIMNMFGLGTSDKTMIAMLASDKSASHMLRSFRKRLYLGMPNTGIAFTIPISGGVESIFSLVNDIESEEESGGGNMAEEGRDSCMILTIVNQGSSDDVMKAARPAGATGGTVFHSRRLGNETATKLLGISIQEEREVVLILARNSRKKEIMEAINASCGISSDAQGIVFSVPIADIEGIG